MCAHHARPTWSERVGGVVDQPRALYPDVFQDVFLGGQAEPNPGPADVVAAQSHVQLVRTRVLQLSGRLVAALGDVQVCVRTGHRAGGGQGVS